MLVADDDLVRLLSQILEGLNYEKLYRAYSSTGRKPAVKPRVLFRRLTYAYIASGGITYLSRCLLVVGRREFSSFYYK